MTALPVISAVTADTKLLALAREIAIDHNTIEEILKNHSITTQEWSTIQRNPNFLRLLESELAAWHSAVNTHERTRLKTAALFEEWLPEANKILHDKDQALPARIELAKLVARVAGMGLPTAEAGGGERFTFTINLGGGEQLKFQKDAPPLTIDATPGDA